jgi:WG containing repeat
MKCFLTLLFSGFLLLGKSQEKIDVGEVQKFIDANFRPKQKFQKFEYLGVEPISQGWELLKAEFYFPCAGDQCAEVRMGLIHEKKDTLLPIFKSIHFLDKKILLRYEQWSATTDLSLRVDEVFSDSRFEKYVFLKRNDFWGVYTMGLAEKIPALYEDIEPYYLEVLKNGDWVTDSYFAIKHRGKWGAVNERNEVVVHPNYTALVPFPGNFSLGAKKEKFGLISSSGQELTPFKYDSVYADFSRQLIVRLGGKLGLLGDDGKEMTPIVYSSITRQSTYGCRCAGKNGKFAMLSGAGKELTSFVYDRIQEYDPPTDVWVLRKSGKWGFYDCELKKELTPFIYDKVTAFSVYEAEVVLNGAKKKIKIK